MGPVSGDPRGTKMKTKPRKGIAFWVTPKTTKNTGFPSKNGDRGDHIHGGKNIDRGGTSRAYFLPRGPRAPDLAFLLDAKTKSDIK